MLCGNCKNMLSNIQTKEQSQIVFSQISKSTDCQCSQLGYLEPYGRFNININIGVKFEDGNENVISFFDHIEIPK